MRNTIVILGLLVSFCLSFVGCSKNSDATRTSQTLLAQMVDSAVGTLNVILNDTERSSSLQAQAACTNARYSPALGAANCNGTVNDRTITMTYSGCTAGPSNEVTLTGAATLAFDSTANCTGWVSLAAGLLPSAGVATWASTTFSRSGTSGTVATSSASHTNYQSTTISGGATITFQAGQVLMNVTGIRRTGSFDHSVRTTSQITVVGSQGAGNRNVTSGTLVIDDNALEYTGTTSISGLTWTDTQCCYPNGGTLTWAFSGSATGSGTATFSSTTCGEVQITDSSGNSTSFTLQSCG